MARFGRSRKSGKAERKPDGEVRQSQLLGVYGAGAMIDLVQHAVLVQGLDDWSYRGTEDELSVEEPRLRDKLIDSFEVPLDPERYFRLAPAGDEEQPSPACGIRVLEFPAHFVCQGCRRLLHRQDLGSAVKADGRRYHERCREGRGNVVVPVRFVAACRHGHLDEFPWRRFAHFRSDRPSCRGELFLDEGKAGDFSEIQVRCSCGASERLRSFQSERVAIQCSAKLPWLPPEVERSASCTEDLRLLVRTASNGYFALTLSALSMDEPEHAIRDALARDAARFAKRFEKGEEAVRDFLEFDHEELVAEYGMELVLGAALALARGEAAKRRDLRSAEYLLLTERAPPEDGRRAFDEAEQLVARRVPSPHPSIAHVSLVHRLREVVVQYGFTRLEPATANAQGADDLGVVRAPLAHRERWLPAAVLRGEGIFFALDAGALAEWSQRPAVVERARKLRAGWDAWHAARFPERKVPRFRGARYYLLHSLSHLLINTIAMECGYSASAIKERIYCGPLDGGEGAEMAGVLLYTGTVGSEGTLGGLVEQGRRLGHHLRRSLESATLCSNDPLCGSHDPEGDRSDRLLEGAACHGCLLIAETSCDQSFNRQLDRSLVVPVMGQPRDVAFFETGDFGER